MRRKKVRNSIFALFLLTTSANAQEIPDEQTKILALKLGYALNGNSMVRWGTIDLSHIYNAAKSAQSAQIEKEKQKKKSK